VLGGVFFGRNAIVVDVEENPEPYELAYMSFEDALSDTSQVPSLEVAQNVGHVVREMMPFSISNVRKVLRAEADARGLDRIRPKDEIGLSRFMGGGICQHQTLFTGALLCLAQERCGIEGSVSVEWEPSLSTPDPERHVWVRYTRGDEKIIVDDSNPTPVFKLERPVASTDRIYLRPGETQEFVDESDLTPDDVFKEIRYGNGEYPFPQGFSLKRHET
jgi:hypothetical protein